MIEADEEASLLFDEIVRPTLEAHCYDCHAESADRVKGGLLLDRREGLLQGGETGPAIVVGDPDNSLLIQAIQHQKIKMPPKGEPLSAKIVEGFRRWVALGAPDPRDAPMVALKGGVDYVAGRRHWAFQPLRVASEDNHGRSLSIDGLVRSRLGEAGLAMAPQASRRDLIRRLSFDLTGLPPSAEEQARFLADSSPAAYERLVDRLLASPRFGERQSQLWLDVVRFAESEGFEYDRHLPGAWRYRDYVIGAFNADKPYDEFIRDQLAGDEAPAPTSEMLSAAIFHRLGAVRRNAGNPDIALSRNEVLIERTDVIGSAIMGLTIGCARCHDHKFDPISQKDYYQVQAFLAASEEHNVDLASTETITAWEEQSKRVEQELRRIRRAQRKAEGEERARLDEELARVEASRPPALPKIPTVKNVYETATKMHVLKRGVWELKGESVGMKALDVLVGAEGHGLPTDSANPRTGLADWLTQADHPLTARVIVNRLWQRYFGHGLVATANNFGRNGQLPSHPVLLDYLASELIVRDWSLKSLHRLILMSDTYRQSARVGADEAELTTDPDNRLLWRHSKRRLTGEEIRDAMLFASGTLNDRLRGESVMLPVEEDLVKLLYKPDQWQVTADPAEHSRRSVYLIAKRNLRLPFMEAFDQPALLSSCFRRESSTHAPQALELLNGQISNELSKRLAKRIRTVAGQDLRERVAVGFQLALGRGPSEEERQAAIPFASDEALEEFALALFNLNEFLYVF